MLRAGQKVVCVDDKPMPGYVFAPGFKPHKGRVYTVKRVFINYRGHPSVDLFELENKNNIGYRTFRFRPITERKTDISVFTEILDKVSQGDRKLIGAE